MRRFAIALLSIALLLPATSCVPRGTINTPAAVQSDGTHALNVTAQALLDISQSLASLQRGIIQANQQGLIPDQTFLAIGAVLLKINEGGRQASSLTKGLLALSPVDRANLLIVFQPLIAAVGQSLDSGLAPIRDPQTKLMVENGLNALRLTMNTMRLALAITN